MKHPNPDMLLRIAQADAYGMAAEYLKSTPENDEHMKEVLSMTRYLPHPSYHHTLKPGMYTDDTQMSTAVAEVMVDGNPHKKQSFQRAFFDCFKRDPRDGYSRGFQSILDSSTSVEDMISRIVPNSDKNGAAMRSVPIGAFRTPSMVLAVAEMQAKITHDTPNGILASQAVAIMSYYAMWTDEPLSSMPQLLVQHLPETRQFQSDWSGRVKDPDVGIRTAHTVCTLVSRETTLMGIMRTALEWGGDTDSVCSIAWGIASARMKEAIPDFFEHGLEQGGKYGVTYLKMLGERLMETYR